MPGTPLPNPNVTLTIALILIGGGWARFVMDYLCAKFGNFSFSQFGFIVRTDRQIDRCA